MFVEGLLDLYRAGILKREVDGAVLHAGFFLGSRAFYRALREMPRDVADKFRMTSISYVNELYGDEDAKRRARVNARFINDAMMATVLGDVISDGLEDGRIVSGVGGQYNFVAQGFALEGARSVIMLRATRTAKGKTQSNIRWRYGHTTIPRHLRDIDRHRIRHRRPSRQKRPRRHRRDAGDHRFALPGRTAAAGQGCRQDRAIVRTAGCGARQHARCDRAGIEAGHGGGSIAGVSVRQRFHRDRTGSASGPANSEIGFNERTGGFAAARLVRLASSIGSCWIAWDWRGRGSRPNGFMQLSFEALWN